MVRWRLRLFWAVLLAVGTGLGVRAYLASLAETVAVVVTDAAIPARTRITEEMLRTVNMRQIDRDRLAADSFADPDQVVGRYARRLIPAGEILRNRPGDLTDPEGLSAADDGEGALAAFLPPGARAVSVLTDLQGVVGQQIQPGDRVDVVFTSTSDSTGGVYASLIVQQVTVLEIEREPEAEEVLVTLLVTVEQAVQISLAKRTGEIDLVLNPPDPAEPYPIAPVSPLLFTRTPAPPEPPPETVAEPPAAPEG